MNNINMEFNIKFDNEDYIITVQATNDKLLIIIEEEKNSVYWKKELDQKIITDITSQMGSYKSLEVFTKMLLCALTNENENISLNFCSLNEIQQLSDNKKSQNNSQSFLGEPENNIKKYLMLVYTQFEKVVYPIQLEYLDKTPEQWLLQRTIARLKEQLKERLNSDKGNDKGNNYIINYSEYEQMKKENINLINKIKILESQRQPGAVDNDNIYKNYAELVDEYNQYKTKNENKIKMLLKTIDDLKEVQFKDSQNNFNQNGKNRNRIQELENQLIIASDELTKERREGKVLFDKKSKEIERLNKEIKAYKENEKNLKVKISKLEKELEMANKKTNYYQYGNSTPKSTHSYHSNNSAHSSFSQGFTSSKKSNTSFLKKNLIPSNPYNKYKGLNNKNYKPFEFMDKKKKVPLRSNSRSKSRGTRSIKSKSSNRSGSNTSKGKNTPSYMYRKNIYNKNNEILNKNKQNSKTKIPPMKKAIVKRDAFKTNEGQISNMITNNINISEPNSKISPNVNNVKVQNYSSVEGMDLSERIGRLQKMINKAK